MAIKNSSNLKHCAGGVAPSAHAGASAVLPPAETSVAAGPNLTNGTATVVNVHDSSAVNTKYVLNHTP